VRARVKVVARFNGIAEPRKLDLNVVIKPDTYRPEPTLLDQPNRLRVSSRQPVQLRRGDTATHVRFRWNGKDRLITDDAAKWKFTARLLDSEYAEQPEMNFSDPLSGRFSLLVSPFPDWKAGERLVFEVAAIGPNNQKLLVKFDADVVEPPPPPESEEKEEKTPRLVNDEFRTGSRRRPPYELKTINRDAYGQQCWNNPEWTDDDAGAFVEPTERSPLVLIINEDMAALREFRQALTKRNTEQDVQRKLNKYTSHIAFHLYQMYQSTIGKKDGEVDEVDAARRTEIHRVALTMLKLMDVADK
jgi:hypothetical protein